MCMHGATHALPEAGHACVMQIFLVGDGCLTHIDGMVSHPKLLQHMKFPVQLLKEGSLPEVRGRLSAQATLGIMAKHTGRVNAVIGNKISVQYNKAPELAHKR